MIRKATMEDMPHIMRMLFELYKAMRMRRVMMFEEASTHMSERVEMMIGHEKCLCLLAEDDSDVHGLLFAIIVPSFWYPDTSEAHEIAFWVDPNKRGAGIGRSMLDIAESWSKEAGAIVFEASSNINSSPKTTQRALRSAGFRLESRSYVKRV